MIKYLYSNNIATLKQCHSQCNSEYAKLISIFALADPANLNLVSGMNRSSQERRT